MSGNLTSFLTPQHQIFFISKLVVFSLNTWKSTLMCKISSSSQQGTVAKGHKYLEQHHKGEVYAQSEEFFNTMFSLFQEKSRRLLWQMHT